MGGSATQKEEFGEGASQLLVSKELSVNITNKLVPEKYDSLALGYTDGDLTSVIYKLATVTVATLALSYTDGNLTNVTKT